MELTRPRRVALRTCLAAAATVLLSGCGGASSSTVAQPTPAESTSTVGSAVTSDDVGSGQPSSPAAQSAPTTATPATSTASSPAVAHPAVVVPLTAPAPPAASSTSLPVQVTIPSIGVDSSLVRLGVDKTGVLIPPTSWNTAGWFAAGTVPGDVGPALIAGHIDSTSGPAVFAKLSTIRPGAKVYVTQADGHRLTFVVDSGKSYPKTAFPTSVVYGPTPVRALRLVTCTGTFDHATGHYLDNYIAYAHLVA